MFHTTEQVLQDLPAPPTTVVGKAPAHPFLRTQPQGPYRASTAPVEHIYQMKWNDSRSVASEFTVTYIYIYTIRIYIYTRIYIYCEYMHTHYRTYINPLENLFGGFTYSLLTRIRLNNMGWSRQVDCMPSKKNIGSNKHSDGWKNLHIFFLQMQKWRTSIPGCPGLIRYIPDHQTRIEQC